MKTAFAIAAHPDDIELMMAGTLLLLKKQGYEIHYLNLSSGNLGSAEYDEEYTKKIRLKEAQMAAEILGAHFHHPFCNDLEIFYENETLRRLAAIIREVKPDIVLTHSPVDYMEDHTNTCRLVVTATFARGMPNYKTIPLKDADNKDCTIYHALPHTLLDPLGRKIHAGSFVNTSSVQEIKIKALNAHHSQHSWLDVSQKQPSHLHLMEKTSLEVGKMSKKFIHAEGWRRHLHFGFGAPHEDPLKDLGENYLINQEYEEQPG
ncbi:MAG: PIG-L family deacetylase [Bacteroidota bacterium]|jgi:LmbE family N-acetylglucosaminyl deacetylase|nr:PIG-L family deacetylase [Bacteroidota bacterium]